jgi:hypothetical protein
MIQLSTPEYVDEALKLLIHEDNLIDRYVPFSRRDILDAIEEILIREMSENLIVKNKASGLAVMIVESRHDQIARLY